MHRPTCYTKHDKLFKGRVIYWPSRNIYGVISQSYDDNGFYGRWGKHADELPGNLCNVTQLRGAFIQHEYSTAAEQPGEHDEPRLALHGRGCREAPVASLSLSSSLAKLRHEKVKFAWMTNGCHRSTKAPAQESELEAAGPKDGRVPNYHVSGVN